jgi:cyclopropane-fatty-acyl-phospholipid synthase
MDRSEATIRGLLELAGVDVNGSRAWDLQVQDPRFYRRILAEGGSLGLGESYMDGWWDAGALDELIHRVLRAGLEHRVQPLKLLLPVIRAKLLNLQNRKRAWNIGTHHYDIGNEMYRLMLDRRLTYTCGYWKEAADLDAAQEAKLDLVCRKIGLTSGMRVLDIGCGWGSFARFAAERYGARVLGITVSREQIELGQELCEGLDVELRFQDYRNVDGQFDRIVSLGMFEHVGPKNYRTYLQVVKRCLAGDGLFLLHTIGTNTTQTAVDPWTDRYIFPGGVLPTPAQVARAAQGVFVLEDWHNFSVHYDQTLMAWMANIDAHRGELERLGYDERFYRMWKFFLLSSAGSFRARRNQLWQLVFSHEGLEGGYDSLR